MKIKIHRGTDQIGGTVTEIKSNKGRIFIDFGSQLQGAKNITNLEIDGLTQGVADSTLLLTHYHGDHIGEIHRVLDDVPVYIGGIAKDISITLCDTLIEYNKEKVKQEEKRAVLLRAKAYENKKSFYVEDIQITPYKVDHSAFDSYMFLIEIDGDRILHTGDYRFHGYQGDELKNTIKDIGEIDYLITEGTMMSRENVTYLTENDISIKAKKYLQENKFVFVLCSSTNIDYIASIFSALPDDKPIIIDEFQEKVLKIVSNSTDNAIYSFFDKKVNIIKKEYEPYKHSIENGFCLLVRKSNYSVFQNNLKKYKDYPESLLLYGLWNGYLSNGSHPDDEVIAIEKMYGDRLIKLHTSGHVYKEDLQKMIEILNPKQGIIPIHTENPKAFDDIAGGCKVFDIEDNHEIQI